MSGFNRYLRAAASVVIACLLCGFFHDWPPHEADAREHFAEHRGSFERLAEKMRGTDYWRVSIRFRSSIEAHFRSDTGELSDPVIIEDDPEWAELLGEVGMFMVLQDGSATWTDPGYLWGDPENSMGHNGFTYDPDMQDDFLLCRPEHERIACGRCAVSLGDDWYIHYVWWRDIHSEVRWEAYLNDEISGDEYFAAWDVANEQCHRDGYAEMGYDVEQVFDLGTTE